MNVLANLNSFLYSNKLDKLKAKLNEFNPFRVLNISEHEIRHSNFLAWLLNPTESHGFGDKILKKIICDIVNVNENLSTSISIYKVLNANLNNTKVFREYKNIDILVIIQALQICLLIENKVNAKESKDQLKRYKDDCRRDYPEYKLIPILLTIEGDIPSGDAEYGIYTYKNIHELIKNHFHLYKEHTNPKVYDFVSYYLKVLELKIMEDSEIKQLCREIYRENKEIIDLIKEYGTETEWEPAGQDFIKRYPGMHLISIRYNLMKFLPKELHTIIPKIGTQSYAAGYPFCIWFQKSEDDKLRIIYEIGPFMDSEKRLELLRYLRDNKYFNIYESSLTTTGQYTRLYAKYHSFNDWDSKEDILRIMIELYEKHAKDAQKQIVKAFEEFKW